SASATKERRPRRESSTCISCPTRMAITLPGRTRSRSRLNPDAPPRAFSIQEQSMSRFRLPVLLAMLGLTAAGFALESKKKNGPDPNTIEARFADGSTLRMMLLQESIDVQTKYGKLTVPVNEIRRIEFAFRLPEETAKKIEAAIKDLGHEVHARREAASQ